MVSSTGAWVEEMDGRGVRLLGHALRRVSDATTLELAATDAERRFLAGRLAETAD